MAMIICAIACPPLRDELAARAAVGRAEISVQKGPRPDAAKLRKLAARGDAAAMLTLGTLKLTGGGGRRDVPAAANLIGKAAAGSPDAARLLESLRIVAACDSKSVR